MDQQVHVIYIQNCYQYYYHVHVPVFCNFDNGYNMQSISHAYWEAGHDVLAIIHSEGK